MNYSLILFCRFTAFGLRNDKELATSRIIMKSMGVPTADTALTTKTLRADSFAITLKNDNMLKRGM